MKVLRTPDERFAGLEGYAFEPHYTEVKDEDGTPLRIHHVEEGPRDAAPVLLMHGNPTWAYLYRKFVPPLAAAGHRVVSANTGIPLGQGESGFFRMWVKTMREAKSFPMQQMLPTGMAHELTPGELAAYQAPFPDPSYQAGICQFPLLIAVQPDNPGVPANREAWERLGRFQKPFLTLFGARDPVTRGGERALVAHVPGAAGQPHHVFPDASHFIQEDVPDELVERLLAFIGGGSC